MTAALTAFLSITLAMAAVALTAVWSRRPTYARPISVAALAACAVVAFFATQAPLGYPDYGAPPAGRYVVLGARIDVDIAIYALLDDGQGEPHLYKLPYTTTSAEGLQSAMYAVGQNGGGGIEAEIGSDGEAAFHEPPVTDDEPKQAETPEFEVG